MKHRAVYLITMVAAGHLTLAEQTTQNPPFRLPDSVQMLADEVYSQPEPLRLDLFSPRLANRPLPGIIFIACGGWTSGFKSGFWRQAAYLAERGFVAAATQCRPAPASRYPTQLNDAVAAIRWLRIHATDYNVDSTRIAVAGASAGGHLAALIGTNRWNGADWSEAPVEVRVGAVVVFNGVLDVPSFAANVAPAIVRTNLTAFLGATSDENKALWRHASPLEHVTTQAAPFLLLHGTNDQTVPYTQSLDMQRALRTAGVNVELFTAEGADHGFFGTPPWYESTTARMTEFLTSVFR